LILYFTDQRIIVGHLSKSGAGAVAPTFMFGSIGAALGGLFGRRKSLHGRSKSEYPSPGQILASHEANFSVSFDEIVTVDLTQGSYKNRIAILSKNDKFDLASSSRFELIRSLFENAVKDRVKIHDANSIADFLDR
jgi:hypothetical protein